MAGVHYQSLGENSSSTRTQDAIPITIRVHKLNYTVDNSPGSWWQRITALQMPWEWMEKKQSTQILHDVSFTARSGQLMAIMGGSGSGKTSLLDVLACRNSGGTVSGDVFLNSVVRTKAIVESCAGYVRQEDRLIAFLTVQETLTFVARLKLPKHTTKATVDGRVNQVLTDLNLGHVADTKVGGESIRGISGGERRRVSIGIQLIISPSVLFLDEPTTGLDSYTASNIVQTLGRLVSKKRTIIMSIHQPRYDIFNIVDTVMILSKGKIVYHGPGRDMVNYFTTLGFPCPEHINPCDFYIDLATVDGSDVEREKSTYKVVRDLHGAYEAKAEAMELFKTNEFVTENQFKRSVESGVYYYPTGMTDRTEKQALKHMLEAFARARRSPGVFIQLWMLMKRFIRITIEDYPVILIQLFQAVMMSTLLGLGYFNLGIDQVSIRDWFGLMFNLAALYPYMVIISLVQTCQDERKFLYFELQDKLYHPAVYFTARLVSDVPFHLLYNLVYCIPVYALSGLDWEFYTCFKFYVYVAASVYVSRCLAMMSAAIFPTFQIACVGAQGTFSILLMCGGFLINIDNMLKETKWVADISYLRWGFEAVSTIEINDLKFTCNNGTEACIRTGMEAMALFGIGGGDLALCAAGIFGSISFFLIIMYLALRYIPQTPVNT